MFSSWTVWEGVFIGTAVFAVAFMYCSFKSIEKKAKKDFDDQYKDDNK